MSRYALQGTISDGNGAVVGSATVAVFLAGTSTVPTMYLAKTGGSPVTTVTTSSLGYFKFYVDDADYPLVTLFDLSISKTGYVTQSYSDIW